MNDVIPLSQPSQSILPQELIRRHRWVCWKTDLRNGKPTKVPINPHTGALASIVDSYARSDFPTALRAHQQFQCDGVGIVLNGDGLVAIDLDHCVEWSGGIFQIEPRAAEIIRAVNSYSEFSPSRTGVHIFAFGSLPKHGRRVERFEI